MILNYKHWVLLMESVDGVQEVYRLIGGGQFGGAAVTAETEPQPGDSIESAFTTPYREAISAIIEFCLDQGENEETGEPIIEEDMRVLVIIPESSRKPFAHEKAMHWESSDADEIFVEFGKVKECMLVSEWNRLVDGRTE